MRIRIHPALAIAVIVAALAAAAWSLFGRAGVGQQRYGMQGLSPELREAIERRGPTPMTPPPDLSGNARPPAPAGPPDTASGPADRP